MKRFVFWFVIAVLAVHWLRSAPHRQDHRFIAARTAVPGTRLVRIEREPHDRLPRLRRGELILEVTDHEFLVRVNDEDAGADEADDLRRVEADGLPVRILPGTRVDEARTEPPRPVQRDAPRPPRRLQPPRQPQPLRRPGAPSATRPIDGLTVVTGRLSATEERARKDARDRLEAMLADRLSPNVPRDWKAPQPLVDGLIRETTVKPVERDYGTLYEASLKADLSNAAVGRIAGVYQRGQVMRRLAALGALLAFVLVCLATVSGYIRADEATKGYYTTKLRLAAAAGVGAAGVLIYQMLA